MSTLHERKADLSVIIPVYNLEDFIKPMLRSLWLQDTGGYSVEIIFVLNNCTDRSKEIIQQSRLDCSILTCTTQGCGPARNVGLEYSSGEYIWFMDGDDWLLTNYAIRDALDMVHADNLDILRIPYTSNHFNMDYFSMVWQYVIRRSLIGDIRFPDFQPCEDDWFMERVLARVHSNRHMFMRLPHLEKPQYHYNYMRTGSNMFRVRVLGEKI